MGRLRVSLDGAGPPRLLGMRPRLPRRSRPATRMQDGRTGHCRTDIEMDGLIIDGRTGHRDGRTGHCRMADGAATARASQPERQHLTPHPRRRPPGLPRLPFRAHRRLRRRLSTLLLGPSAARPAPLRPLPSPPGSPAGHRRRRPRPRPPRAAPRPRCRRQLQRRRRRRRRRRVCPGGSAAA